MPGKEAASEYDAKPVSFADVIREHANEGEEPLSRNFTLGKILGGDILNAEPIRRQIWVFLLITLFLVIYISNRYSCQQYLIQIDNLNKELKEVCLLEQVYVKAEDGKQSVSQYVAEVAKANGAKIAVKKFVRFETGEGMEKKNEDFAAEVAKQMGQKASRQNSIERL